MILADDVGTVTVKMTCQIYPACGGLWHDEILLTADRTKLSNVIETSMKM